MQKFSSLCRQPNRRRRRCHSKALRRVPCFTYSSDVFVSQPFFHSLTTAHRLHRLSVSHSPFHVSLLIERLSLVFFSHFRRQSCAPRRHRWWSCSNRDRDGMMRAEWRKKIHKKHKHEYEWWCRRGVCGGVMWGSETRKANPSNDEQCTLYLYH